jgi:hypothetical protein
MDALEIMTPFCGFFVCEFLLDTQIEIFTSFEIEQAVDTSREDD